MGQEPNVQVAHIGNMANDSFAICEGLQEQGYLVDLYLESAAFGMGTYHWEIYDVKDDPYTFNLERAIQQYGLLPWVKVWWHKAPMKPSDIIHLYKITAHYRIRQLHSPFPIFLQFLSRDHIFGKKRFNIIHEAGWGRKLFDPQYFEGPQRLNGSAQKLARRAYSLADRIVMTNPDMYSFEMPFLLDKHGRRRDCFIPFAINTKRYAPRRSPKNDDLILFHPARQIWNVKGNDRLLKGFKIFIENGYKGKLRMVDWGWSQDVERMWTYIRAHGLTAHIEFLQPMNKIQLIRQYHLSDVVCDQFILGSFGTLAPESMSCGKPVMMYLNTWNIGGKVGRHDVTCYGEMPPVVHASRPEEIAVQLILLTDRRYRMRKGKLGRDFILRKMDYHLVAGQHKELYHELLEGNGFHGE